MIVTSRTDIGQHRKINQDSYLVLKHEGFTLVSVCDGMGGANAGEVASAKAVEYLKTEFENHPPLTADVDEMRAWLKETISGINLKLYTLASSSDLYHGMGTTMVCVLHHKKATVMANIGDSRIYTYSDALRQITMDHTLVQEWINQGRLSEKDAKIHPQRSILTNVLAILPEAVIDLFELDETVKLILCCSDGLHGYVEDDEIEKVLRSHDDQESKTQQLIDLANAKGGYDNTTVVLMAL
jgi:PPM family protein phosphatase